MYKKILVSCFAVIFLLSMGLVAADYTDWDEDGVLNEDDNCWFIPNPGQEDTNENCVESPYWPPPYAWDPHCGDACENDYDNDGYNDNLDNCMYMFNPAQIDIDGDLYGNVCDPDFDNDCVVDWDDLNAMTGHYHGWCGYCEYGHTCWDADYWIWCDCSGYNPLYDITYLTGWYYLFDWGFEDPTEIDIFDVVTAASWYGGIPGPSGLKPPEDPTSCQYNNDGDGVPDVLDNCPNIWNPNQEDADGDDIGDVCDSDIDGDSIYNWDDNCPYVANPDQADFDGDDLGDACDDDDDNDGVLDSVDACPYEDSTGFDADGDGCIDTIEGLTEVVNTLPDDALADETKNSLVSKVDNALNSVDKENDEAGINQLQAFINQIEAQKGKKISEEAANELIEYANNLIAQIEEG